MSHAVLWIKPQPRRMISEKEAAAYLGVPVSRFKGMGIASIEVVSGLKTYDIHDLDQRIDLIKAGSADPDETILSRLE
jgi:hypothetical protein